MIWVNSAVFWSQTFYSYFLAFSLTFSGTERSKDTSFFIHSLAQRTNQETSTPSKASPYMGRMQHRKIAETVDFLPFWYRGTRDEFFIGWRIEGCKPGHAMVYLSGGAWRKSLTLIIYTIAKYSFRKSSAVICLISNSSKPRRSRVKMTSAPNTEFE